MFVPFHEIRINTNSGSNSSRRSRRPTPRGGEAQSNGEKYYVPGRHDDTERRPSSLKNGGGGQSGQLSKSVDGGTGRSMRERTGRDRTSGWQQGQDGKQDSSPRVFEPALGRGIQQQQKTPWCMASQGAGHTGWGPRGIRGNATGC